MTYTSPWGELAEERHFSVTADQDWAPEWATKFLLEWAEERDIPLHFFTTNPSETILGAHREGRVGLGWHPNFLRQSTHGTTEAEVVAHMAAFAPDVRSVRSHAFSESSLAWSALEEVGITVDSQGPSDMAGYLVPFVHASGIVRFPVWFEDDVWLKNLPEDADPAMLWPSFDAPGLKILNLHPIHMALNTPTFEYYNELRPRLYTEGAADIPSAPWGVRDVVEAIVDRVRDAGEKFHPFEELADKGLTLAQASPVLSLSRVAAQSVITR